MGFIENLYFGKIHPSEKWYNKPTKYSKALKTFCSNEEQLSKSLTGENLNIFNELVKASNEISAINSIENFKIGFRLAVQMMCDSLVSEEIKIFRNTRE